MPIQTTGNLADSIRTLYSDAYLRAAMTERVYDQYATSIDKQGVEKAARLGNVVQVEFLSDMTPGTTTISQTLDIVPQQLRDSTATISPTSRGEALQWAESVDIQTFTDYGKARVEALGKNQMETVDNLASAAATQGSLVLRAAARASLDAGTSTHRLSDSVVSEVETTLLTLKCPAFIAPNDRKQWFATMHPAVFHDLRTGGNVVSVAQYQQGSIILNFELGEIGPFKIIVTPFAKTFLGQGLANASAVATTLNGAVEALAKQIIVASGTNISAGDWLHLLDTAETGDTHVYTNERVKYVSGTTTVVLVGEGANGGLRFDHASGISVTNADTVYPVVYGGPASLAKLWDSGMDSEFGTVVGPLEGGVVHQFATLGWKFYGGYGRWNEAWVLRGEYASSLEA